MIVNWDTPKISEIIDYWIDEDLGSGDLTESAITHKIVKANWIAKEDGVFCGSEIIKIILRKIDKDIKVSFLISDGDKFHKNQRIIELEGPSQSLLASERITLNIAMHLSGISTHTSLLVEKLKNTKINLADTRKTTPGLRIFEKYAFKCGGGINHRMGLYDAAMIKENHIAWSNDLYSTVKNIRSNTSFTTHIIIEAENKKQAEEAVLAGADSILLDEIEPKLLKNIIEKVRKIAKNNNESRKNLIIEVSGINPYEIDKYIINGIDYISTSSSTTKSNWIDFSMRYID